MRHYLSTFNFITSNPISFHLQQTWKENKKTVKMFLSFPFLCVNICRVKIEKEFLSRHYSLWMNSIVVRVDDCVVGFWHQEHHFWGWVDMSTFEHVLYTFISHYQGASHEMDGKKSLKLLCLFCCMFIIPSNNRNLLSLHISAVNLRGLTVFNVLFDFFYISFSENVYQHEK